MLVLLYYIMYNTNSMIQYTSDMMAASDQPFLHTIYPNGTTSKLDITEQITVEFQDASQGGQYPNEHNKRVHHRQCTLYINI